MSKNPKKISKKTGITHLHQKQNHFGYSQFIPKIKEV